MQNFSEPLSCEVLLGINALSKNATGIYTGENVIIEYANDVMISFWGKDRSVIGKPMAEAVPELVGQPFVEILQKVWRTGETYSDTAVEAILPSDGHLKPFYFDFEYRAILNKEGKTYAILHTANDVTERVHNQLLILEQDKNEKVLISELTAANLELAALNSELADTNEQLIISDQRSHAINQELIATVKSLEESEARFRLMAEGTDVMIAVGDETGRAVYFNNAWAKLTGRSVEDLLAFGWVDLMHPDDRQRITDIFGRSFTKQVAWEWEFRIPDKSNNYRWMLARGIPRFDNEGSFLGYISSTIDLTDRKAEEDRRSDFIGIVSHELRSPLTSINGYFQVLEMKAKNAADQTMFDIAVRGRRQAARMGAIISGFLDVARLGQSKLQLNRKNFDMAELVKSAEAESLVTITSHKVIYYPVEYTPVEADWDKVEQVVVNFVNNAVKYSPKGSTIHVACITRDGMAHVSVAD